MSFFISDAFAQAPAAAPGGAPYGDFIFIILLFVVFYFLLIRPQNKRQKEHREMVANLSVGDEVVTAGGVLGKVTELSEQFVQVEVADGVVLKVQRHTIGGVMPKGTVKSA